MTGLGWPRDWFAELIVDGAWEPLETAGVSDVRQTDPITITRGRGDEQGSMPPSTLTEVLDSPDGKYNQENVFSPLYGQLGENTPVRQGLNVAADTFARTVASGWGTASTGETWTVSGTNTSSSVGSGVGTQSISAANAICNAVSNVAIGDCYLRVDYTPSFTNVTGGLIEIGPTFRRNADGDYYYGRVVITTAEAYQLEVWRFVDSAWTQISESTYTVPGLTHTSGQAVAIAGVIEGRVIALKLWLAADPEPYEWQLIASDGNDESAILEPGFWGIRSEVSSGNSNAKPITFGYDNLDVRIMRASGELTSLVPWWNENHNVKVSSLKASDVWQRLRRSSASIRSALRRAIDTDDEIPLNYWPCEDLVKADTIASGLDTAPAMAYTDAIPDFGAYTGFDCSAPVLYLNKAQLAGSIPAYTHTGDIISKFLMFVPDGGTVDGQVIYRVQYATGSVWRWEVVYHTSGGGSLSVHAYDFNNVSLLSTGSSFGVDGEKLRVQFGQEQNGADIHWSIAILEVGTTSGFFFDGDLAGKTLGVADNVVFNPGLGMDDVAIGHVVIYNVVTSLFDQFDPLRAFAGETTGRRMLRTCLENGITGAVWGDPDEGAPMGPQKVGTLANVFDLIAATEQGPVFSARSFNGLILRMRHTLYAQEPMLILDYSAGEVGPPLTPAPDDNGRVNDVTAKRVDGSSFRSVQETGPKNAGRPWEDPEAIGPITGDVDVSTHTDAQLRDIADMELRIGTAAETRYPQITVDLAADTIDTALLLAVLAVNVGDRLQIISLQDADIYRTVDQIVQGSTETSPNQYLHSVVFNASQYSPYDTMLTDVDYLDGDIVLAENVDSTETGIDITADVLLSTTAGDYPQACRINGEEMTVTAVAGASFPQTMTVVRGVNTGGVGLTHFTGDTVQFIPTSYIGR